MRTDQPAAHGPAVASRIRRTIGWLVDYLLIAIPAVILVGFALTVMLHNLPGYIGAVAADFGWSRLVKLVTSHGRHTDGLGSIAFREWIVFATPAILALLAVPMLQFAYQATLLAWRGSTIGKFVTDSRIGTPDPGAPRPRRGLAVRRALITTALDTGLVCAALVVVVLGQFLAGMLLWIAAVAAFWINAITGCGRQRRNLADRLAGTMVVRRASHSQVARPIPELAPKTSDTAIAAGRRGSGRAVTAVQRTSRAVVSAGHATADATAVAGQLTREGVEALTHSAAVQQVRSSRAAQRAQELGGQAATQARQLGGRAQEMWRQRKVRPELPGSEQSEPLP